MESEELIVSDKEILGGIPVFTGTRVPVETMIDYLEGGHPLDEFLDDFPTVDLDHARKVLDLLKASAGAAKAKPKVETEPSR